MYDLDAEFEKLRARIDDAYDNRFIDGDALDRLGVTMCLLFVDEAKQVELANGDRDIDDEHPPTFAEIDDLYRQVAEKRQFIGQLEIALYQINKFSDAVELADFIRGRVLHE
ncbi:MAG: hypothetical protein LRY53_08090 [Burkholderiaceae bacterium]|nr:hypothetical protein [Burkholderiaceae bacterium]MCD8517630.1 hypothetical protein [Burkholderiaceae bacterium]MCD8537424.1 hypothetical protein [Burkholderiaceae bacterium]MCD8565582.1 hypothetical protein [Burkholderiaceae bacterium]